MPAELQGSEVGHCRSRPRTRKYTVANIKSQIKRIKTNQKAQERNRAVKSEVRTAVRSAREAIAAGDKDKAQDAVKNANRKLDKAASKGVIHKNQAANKKSAISKQAAAL
jgi:small subunit ribosomal protein S20